MSCNPLCPMCGAYGPGRCELEDECGGVCPWVESGQHGRDCHLADEDAKPDREENGGDTRHG